MQRQTGPRWMEHRGEERGHPGPPGASCSRVCPGRCVPWAWESSLPWAQARLGEKGVPVSERESSGVTEGEGSGGGGPCDAALLRDFREVSTPLWAPFSFRAQSQGTLASGWTLWLW